MKLFNSSQCIILPVFLATAFLASSSLLAESTSQKPLPPSLHFAEHYQYPIPKDDDCSPLAIGQSKVIDIPDQNSHTGVGGHYKITRLKGHKHYQVDVNVDFEMSDEYLSNRLSSLGKKNTRKNRKKLSQETQALYQWRAQSCLRLLEPKFRSKDGTKFKIVMNAYNGRGHKKQAPKQKVKLLTHNNKITNSENWASAIPCTMVVHEIFHLLGLPDGYPSNSLSTEELHQANVRQQHKSCSHNHNNSYCRHPEPPGIMNHYQNFDSNAFTYLGLKCDPINSQDKSRVYQQVRQLPSKCPDGYRVTGANRTAYNIETIRSADNKKDGVIVYYSKLERDNKHLLGNAHAKFITHPRCVSENQNYLTCIQNAGRLKGDCLNTPPHCQGDFIN